MANWKEKLRELKGGAKSRAGTTSPHRESRAATPKSSPPAQPKRHVCLGLDFGTSSTKAVIRLLTTPQTWAIPFPGLAHKDEPYLAPTRLRIDAKGALSLDTGSGGWVEEMKVRLMEQPWVKASAWQGAEHQARATDFVAAYLGLVLRRALPWFDKEIRPKLGPNELVWALNLGIPARDHGTEEINSAFRSAACAGWQLAQQAGPLDLAAVVKVVDLARSERFSPTGIDSAAVNVVPEVAAGVTTYVRSSQRQLGAHFFVDVGATTLDTSVFLLVQTPEVFKYVFLSADVDSQLGAYRLHKYRANELGKIALAKFIAADPLEPVPETAKDCLPTDAEVRTIDLDFRKRCEDKIIATINTAKKKDPSGLNVPESRGGASDAGVIRVLVNGGGTSLPLYKSAIDQAGKLAAPGGGRGLRIKPFKGVRLEEPAGLIAPGLSKESWKRLSIAYGLSFAIDDIGEFVPPSKVQNMPQLPQRDTEANFIDKDQT